jgi:hypothetical protein
MSLSVASKAIGETNKSVLAFDANVSLTICIVVVPFLTLKVMVAPAASLQIMLDTTVLLALAANASCEVLD